MEIDLDHLCEFLAEGGTLKDYASVLGVSVCTLSRWIAADTARQQAVSDARALYGHSLVGEMLAIADDGQNDTYIHPETGRTMTDYDVVARSKLRVATRQWLATKYTPAMFGDKITTEHTGRVEVKRYDMTDEELLAMARAGRPQ